MAKKKQTTGTTAAGAPRDPQHEPLEEALARLYRRVDGYNEVTEGEPRENLEEWATSLPNNSVLDEASGGANDLWQAVQAAQGGATLVEAAAKILDPLGFTNLRTERGSTGVVAGAQLAMTALRLLVSSGTFERVGVVMLGRASLEATATGVKILLGRKNEASLWEKNEHRTKKHNPGADEWRAEPLCNELDLELRKREPSAPRSYRVYDWACEHTHVRYKALTSPPTAIEAFAFVAYVSWAAAVGVDVLVGCDLARYPRNMPDPLPW